MIAEFDIDTQAMQSAFRHAPQIDASIIQQTACESGRLDVVVNVSRAAFDDFERGLDADGTIEDWVRFSDSDDCRRYRLTLTEQGRELVTYPCWSESGAVFLDGNRRRDSWRFRIQFPDEDSLQRYVAYCEDRTIDFSPIRLSRTDSSNATERFGLTPVQAQTLVTASERGFFSIPRECTLEELADEWDISHQALSERLRRGMSSLIESTLR
ncbi:helix-turn-helix domain-containing protein [Halobellus sp. GM3]|uniref:helix-turn-helix domain-containing protein n=1 Tax=Halobellus sp. GM3 TaxID=3458410 RepID=UPI00403E2F43